MRQNCPVCFEYLFDSVRPTAVLPCGHTIHSECLKDMEKNRQLACPICMKTYADLAPIWRRVDEEVAETPMPPDYAHWVAHILCNDCNQVQGRTSCLDYSEGIVQWQLLVMSC
jgi:RING finger/CHY zinc finger protein 1